MASTIVKQLQEQFGEVITTTAAKPNAQWYNVAAFAGLSVHFDPESQMRIICNSAQSDHSAKQTLASLQEILEANGIPYTLDRQSYNLMPSNQRAHWSAIRIEPAQLEQFESVLAARQSSSPRPNL